MGVGYGRVPVSVRGVTPITGSGSPRSGTYGTGKGQAGTGSTYFDTARGVLWANEGTSAAPYWSPVTPIGDGLLWGYRSEFSNGVGKAHANTDANAILNGGWRVFGQGITETDSGLVVSQVEGIPTARLTTTDEAAHLAAIGGPLITNSGAYQPDTHGVGILDVEFAVATALTNKALFIGYVGISPDAMDPPISIATTVITLVQDDLFGVGFDAAAGGADRLYVAHNKANEAATQATTAGGRDTSTDVAAAGTFQRVRVEDDADGGGRVFVNKTQVFEGDSLVDVDEELNPVVAVISNTTAVQAIDIRRAVFVASR